MTQTKPSSPAYDFLEPSPHSGDLGMLGSYRILGELGKGGMGFVFRAEDTVLKRAVALKVMNKRIAATPNSRERFIQEARSMAAVHHDNVVVIFEVDQHNGTPFMAMEMLKGQTLEEIHASGELPDYQTVIAYAKQMCRGLAAAHAKGIVHRDIKPANIWLEEGSSRIKILDFGLALAQTPVDEFAKVGSVAGTPAYLAPEQARSDPLDDRTDLYSLGVVLYEFACGRRPFAQAVLGELLVAVLSHEAPNIRQFNDAIPEPLAEFIHSLLKKEAGSRPPSAAALVDQLDEVAQRCEAKSEVALSINKLQASLQEVVQKQESGELDVEAVELIDEPPTYDPLAMPLPTEYPSPVSLPGSVTQQVAAAAPARPTPKRPGSKPAPNSSTNYLPWVAAGGVAGLLLLGGLAFAFLGGDDGGDDQPTRIAQNTPTPLSTPPQPPTVVSSASNESNHTDQSAKPENGNSNSKPKDDWKRKQEERERQNRATETKPKQTDPKQTVQNNDPAETKSPDLGKNNAVTESTPSPAMNLNSTSPMVSAKVKIDSPGEDSLTMPKIPSNLNVDLTEDMANTPSESTQNDAPVTLRSLPISTLDGNGADATVKSEDDRKAFGTLSTLTVQERRSGTLQHAYLRFDLGSTGVDLTSVRDAKIVLTPLRNKVPKDGEVRVYGYSGEPTELWQESGRNSIVWSKTVSSAGLDEAQLLAVWKPEQVQPSDGSKVVIRDERLTGFLQKLDRTSATFVLAGGRNRGVAVTFYSREDDSEQPPELIVMVPGDAG